MNEKVTNKAIKQDDFFLGGECDAWFMRNRDGLINVERHDWTLALLNMLEMRHEFANVIEVGCANGWRLAQLKERLQAGFTGVDGSRAAIADGTTRYPGLRLIHGSMAELPVTEEFDLTIVSYVLHWIDRTTLALTVSEIDRVTRDGGILIIGDFLPDFPQRRVYHHAPGHLIYTYKQDYARLFEALGTYRELARVTYNHDSTSACIQASPSTERGVCVMLQKSLQGYYHQDT
jgi:SAM-dependent methyltransferase